MADEWRETRLSDLCDITRGASPRPIHEWITEEGIPWVKISDASSAGSRYINRTGECIRREGKTKSVSVFPGDLILSNSATPGIPMFLGIEACIHDGWLLLRNFRGLDKLFAYYLLLHERTALVQQGNGSVFTNLKTDILKNHIVRLPPLEEQRAIAHILGILDDKIELNRRMNETLETMARALFKSWFVDFDPIRAKAEGRDPGLPKAIADLFPDSFEESELGEIPKGWSVGTLMDISLLNPEAWSKETRPQTIRYVDLSNTKWGRIEQTTVYAQQDAPSRAQRVLRPRDTIVGTVRPGNGSYALISENDLTGSTGFAVLRPKKPEYAEYVFLSVTSPDNIKELAHLADGGAYPAVRPDVVSEQTIVMPAGAVVEVFSKIVQPLMSKLLMHESDSRALAEVRDSLLPRMVGGEIKVGGKSV